MLISTGDFPGNSGVPGKQRKTLLPTRGSQGQFPSNKQRSTEYFLVEQRDNTLRNITSNIRGAKLPSTDKEVSREQLTPEY